MSIVVAVIVSSQNPLIDDFDSSKFSMTKNSAYFAVPIHATETAIAPIRASETARASTGAPAILTSPSNLNQ